jgi:hypothetical protein
VKNFNDKARPPPKKQIVKLIEGLAYRHDKWRVFSDFVEMSALAMSNAVDWRQREKREERYMQIVQAYSKDELDRFPDMLGELTLALEDEPCDVLGSVFHELELHNKWTGQYFSPYSLCRMMAKMTLSDGVQEKIAERGFVSAAEPACGSGAMVIALAHEMRDMGINYQKHLHVTAVDVDPKCVHMAYVQLSLLHVPAVIVHGNSLSLEEHAHWFTPAHIIDGWSFKLRNAAPMAEQFKQAAPVEAPVQPQALPVSQPEPPEADRPRSPPGQLTLF